VSTARGSIGAAETVSPARAQPRQHEGKLLGANSRIMDVDVSEETSALSRNQVLVQAGVAVLAQANQMPSYALSLLRAN